MLRLWLIAVTLTACASAKPEPLEPPAARRTAHRRPPHAWPHEVKQVKGDTRHLTPIAASLANVDAFAIGGVGFTGAVGEGEKLARALAREPDARAMFEELAIGPNRAARLYAYWALRKLDPARAAKLREELDADPTKVEIQVGCIVNYATASKIAESIEALPDSPTYQLTP